MRYNIPENFESSINFIGFNFKTRNLIEGGIIGVVPSFLICTYAPIGMKAKLYLVVLVVLPFAFLGLTGIHGDPLSKRIALYFRYKKRRRMCIYNPRIKDEIVPMAFMHDKVQMLPKEKLRMLYDNYKKKNDQKAEEQIQAMVSEWGRNLFFIDDEGQVDKPYEYMTSSEKRKYRRRKKKDEKLRKKEEKQTAAMNKRNKRKMTGNAEEKKEAGRRKGKKSK